jgi:hypothetical protein
LSEAIFFIAGSVRIVVPVEAIMIATSSARPSSPTGAPVYRMRYLSGAIRTVGERSTLLFCDCSSPTV